MFMIEIAGIRTLYTGDFSVHETRHLCGAEIPQITPDILVAVIFIYEFSIQPSFSGINLWHASSRKPGTSREEA